MYRGLGFHTTRHGWAKSEMLTEPEGMGQPFHPLVKDILLGIAEYVLLLYVWFRGRYDKGVGDLFQPFCFFFSFFSIIVEVQVHAVDWVKQACSRSGFQDGAKCYMGTTIGVERVGVMLGDIVRLEKDGRWKMEG